jgi:hypothetical protein
MALQMAATSDVDKRQMTSAALNAIFTKADMTALAPPGA